MIVQRIHAGDTAEKIGISKEEFASRKKLYDRYMAENDGQFAPSDYLAWLQSDAAGDRGPAQVGSSASIPVVKSAPDCGCKKTTEMPTVAQMGKSLVGEVGIFARSGFKVATKNQYQERLVICAACEEFTRSRRCRVCGCFMAVKAKMATTDCPQRKWPSVTVTEV